MTVVTKTSTNVPQIRIPLTEGNIRNGHVYLREFLWFFPKNAMRNGHFENGTSPCEIELPGIGVIESEIDPEKAIFRWRGWKKFFRAHGAASGDVVVFSRKTKSRFSVDIEHVVLDGMNTPDDSRPTAEQTMEKKRRPKRCNDLSGDEWLRYSISVWSDIKKTAEETALKHPAIFPSALCERLMLMFLPRRRKQRVLDPFMGSGSTIVAARNLGKVGIGFDISDKFLDLARRRLESPDLFQSDAASPELIHDDARNLLNQVARGSIDLCITSPPYWDILNQQRTADSKQIRHYGNLSTDLGTVKEYGEFLSQLTDVFQQVLEALRPGAYCVVVVMDLRKKDRFYPFHSDLAARLQDIGFIYDDLIIWDRGHEYNNLRPLGYPSVFRVNKIHEFILIFQKPGKEKAK